MARSAQIHKELDLGLLRAFQDLAILTLAMLDLFERILSHLSQIFI